MNGKVKAIALTLLLLVAEAVVFFWLYDGKEAKSPAQAAVEISLKIESDNIADEINEKGIKVNGAVIKKILPDELRLTFLPDEKNEYELSEIRLNGRKLSYDVFADVCENYLDFDCFLVYNKT